MYLVLSNGQEILFTRENNHFSVFEVNEDKVIEKIGSFDSFSKALEGLLAYQIVEKSEVLTVEEMLNIVSSTCDRCKNWFLQHADYLEQLDK
ncbi:hypothetical protein CEP45_03950 [Mergibacter septicus]|uniref:hypothetical protein n=1 Tax=Mergibacter septicus TaxID=221402 RepID=UPI001C77344D|nr:hypothetical protein [Mergibacter septicus]QDJ13054.1 hypothetical protein CEP45_03950 [Mergibacter septicus]